MAGLLRNEGAYIGQLLLSPPAGYNLIFEDDFDGVAIDTDKWGVESNGTDDPTMVTVSAGNLHLRTTGTEEADRLSGEVRASDSIYLNAAEGGPLGIANLFAAPGWLEVYAKPAEAAGVISTILLWHDAIEWTQNSDDFRIGENDALEARGFQPHRFDFASHHITQPDFTPAGQTIISQGGNARVTPGIYHQFVAWWDAGFVWYHIDGLRVFSRDLSSDPFPIFGRPAALTLGCWIGADADAYVGEGGFDYPIDTEMLVDYVRFYSPTAGPLPFTETWTGDNDDPWDHNRWTHVYIGHTGSATIQSNQGHTEASGAAYVKTAVRSAMPYSSDIDLTMTFTLLETGVEQYHQVYFRVRGPWSNNIQHGYIVQIDSAGQIQLFEVDDYSGTTLGTAAKTWNTDPWSLRIQAIGSALKVKVWQGSEPGTWDIEQTDANHPAGELYLGSGNGNAVTARAIRWDALSVSAA